MTTTHDHIRHLSLDNAYDLKQVETDLRRYAVGIINEMQRLIADLDNGMNINELGVLQSRGRDLDSLCGKRQSLLAMKRRLDYIMTEADDAQVDEAILDERELEDDADEQAGLN